MSYHRVLDCSIRTSLLLIFHRRRLAPASLALVNRQQILLRHYSVIKLPLLDLERHLHLVQPRLPRSEPIQASIPAPMLDPHCLTRRSNHLDKHRDFLSELHPYLQLGLVITLSLIFDLVYEYCLINIY